MDEEKNVQSPPAHVEEEQEAMEVTMTTQQENPIVTPESADMPVKTQTQPEETEDVITNSTAAVPPLDRVSETEDIGDDGSEDSDSDSSSSSSSLSPSHPICGDDDDEGFSQPAPIKTRDEVLLEELPAVEDVSVSLPESAELQPVGTVSSIIQQLVVIQSLKDTPPLTDESIIFRSDRLALAKVFEVFGPVSSPLYILRFNSVDQISSKELTEGMTVYYAPDIKEYTRYIFIQQLKLLRGSDASWKNDHEPPTEALDYSDDEKEQEAKRKLKNSRRKDKNKPDNPNIITQNTLQQQDKSVPAPPHADTPFRHQNRRNRRQPFKDTHTPTRHMHPPPQHTPPMYLPPPPCPYPPPFPPPNFPLYPPPPPPSFFNHSFSSPPPFWRPNSVPFADFPPPPPPPPPPPQ